MGRSRSGWDTTTGYRAATATNGGVSVHSVWPIVRAEQHIFSRACGADWFSGKGFAYVELAAPDGPLHVVGTHMQSEDGACRAGEDAEVRTHQLDQIRGLLDAKDIPDDEPVYLAGGLNIVGGSAEWDRALARLDAVEPAFTGAPCSWDTGTNSIAGDNHPDWAPNSWTTSYRSATGPRPPLTPTRPAT